MPTVLPPPSVTESRLFDWEVIPQEVLGVDPGPGEHARRIVRYGLKKYLDWWGEDVGPEPWKVAHFIAYPQRRQFLVSPFFHELLLTRSFADYDGRMTWHGDPSVLHDLRDLQSLTISIGEARVMWASPARIAQWSSI